MSVVEETRNEIRFEKPLMGVGLFVRTARIFDISHSDADLQVEKSAGVTAAEGECDYNVVETIAR